MDRADLKIGSVVRLASGSIKFTVERLPQQGYVGLVGWGDRVGVVRALVPAACLCWPRDPRAPDEA
jgi:hypothetical protein